MRNQIDAANNLGIRAITLNSTNRDEWPALIHQVQADQVDCLLISPERLANEYFINEVLLPIADKIGLLVVDEAHCISDWGHDFRPDYRRLLNILKQMPPNMPVLGTTATANNRVIEDVIRQLGDMDVLRGPLVRESLTLQNITLPDQASRLAWLSINIPKLDLAGIVYVLTKRDAEQVTSWLQSQGIDAAAYYSGVECEGFANSDAFRQNLELVATTALGMGYDKPDLGFVIHYQAPGSIVAYYQQVGRAGRGIEQSYGVLLSGHEDERIHEFFRRSAFPSEKQVNAMLSTLGNSDGLSVVKLQEHLNHRKGQIDKVLKFLSVESPAPVIKDGPKWHRTPVHFQMDQERIAHLTDQREQEWGEVQTYVNTTDCLMEYLRNALDDPASEPCGKCANCVGSPIVSPDIDRAIGITATQYLKHSEFVFKHKIQVAANAFPIYGFRGNLPANLQASDGRILSRWGDAGWGGLVEHDKHAGSFRQELVDAAAEMIAQRWQPNPAPQWVTCVPSLNHPELVPDFAQRLAAKLGLPFFAVISKTLDNAQQKFQQNRYHQCRNLDGAFAVAVQFPAGPMLLVDDVIDSGWTVTVLAALLRQQGCEAVYPVSLASTSTGD